MAIRAAALPCAKPSPPICARRAACAASAQQIIVTSGAQQGLDLLIRAIIRPGDAVWIEDPCYPMALTAFKGAGARVIAVPVDEEGLDPARGETALRSRRGRSMSRPRTSFRWA